MAGRDVLLDETPTSDTSYSKQKRRVWLFVAVAWVMITLVAVAGVLTGAGVAIGWGIAPISMVFVTITSLCGGCCLSDPGTANDSATATTRQTRNLWMANAKTFLISCVAIGHSGLAFLGQGAGINFDPPQPNGYQPVAWTAFVLLKPLVVPMFFFVSGFFAPSSLDRKGPAAFLRANFIRLGVVYFIFWLVINPGMYYWCDAVIQPNHDRYSYFPNSAATWFLNVLLVLQCCYALVGGSILQMEIPSPCKLVQVCLGVGFMQLVASAVLTIGGTTTIAEMPMIGPGGDGFFGPLMFAAGIVAKRNNWIDTPLPDRLVRFSRWYVFIMAVATALVFTLVFTVLKLSKDKFFVVLFAFQIPCSPYLGCLQVTVVDFFQRRCNFENGFTKCMAEGAFAVYLIHYWVINVFLYSYVKIMESTHDEAIPFVNGTKTTADIGVGCIYGGFVYVASLTVITSFLLAALLKRLPGLKKFL